MNRLPQGEVRVSPVAVFIFENPLATSSLTPQAKASQQDQQICVELQSA